MNIKPIRNEDDYRNSLLELSAMFNNQPLPCTEEGDRLEVMLILVEAYETKHFPIDHPDPIEAIMFRIEQAGLTAKDLVSSIGTINRVHEVLTRKKRLTIRMIRNLHKNFGIPVAGLISEYRKPS